MFEISKRIVLINSASSVATQVLHFSVLVWLQQYLLRRISPEEYALYPVVMAVMVFSPLLTVFLTSGLGRFVVVAHARDERQVTQIVQPLSDPARAGFLVLGLGWWFAWNVAAFSDPRNTPGMPIMLATLISLRRFACRWLRFRRPVCAAEIRSSERHSDRCCLLGSR
jgi:hypothetical protein